jgi:hypothetical protein
VGLMFKYMGIVSFAVLAMQSDAIAGDGLFDDLFGPYRYRRDTIAPGAGNAKDMNAAVHVVDPWPPYAGARHIPGDGKRAAEAVRRYHQSGDPAQTEPAAAAPLPIPTGLLPGTTGGDVPASH